MKNNLYFNKMSKTQTQTPPNSRDDQQSILTLSKASQMTFSKNEQSTHSTVILDGFHDRKIPKLFQSIDVNGREHNKKKSSFLKNISQKSFSIKSTHSMSKQKDRFKTFKGNNKIKKIMIDLRQPENNLINSSTKESISLVTSKMKFSKENSLNSSIQIFNSKSISAESINIKVYARMRPSKQEYSLFRNHLNLLIDKKYVTLQNAIFNFDQVFDDKSNQKQIFERVAQPVIQDIFNGYNGTIFAYGQTGSGKTHTMFGNNQKQELKGLIPRTVQYIFKQISKREQIYQISASMLQIYKQNMLDLFSVEKNQLKIKQSTQGIYVQGLSNLKINNCKNLLELIEFGQQIRKVSSTKMNKSSSRSHTIIIIYIQSQYNILKKGKLYLVDLAGSQKVSKSGASGENLEQAKKINLSLSCLGNVINALTSKISKSHIPYRDSKLTRLLQDSLSGNFKTSIIVNFSAEESSYQQTLSTMKFAQRAKKIKNSVKINTDIKQHTVQNLYLIINKLTNELQQTKNELKKYKQNENQFDNEQDDVPSARLIIPSERANVSQHLKNYKSKSIKPLRINLNLDSLSSLNSFQDSSILGSRLEFNQSYTNSKEVSLNFSIKNDDNSILQSYIQKTSNNKVK